MALQSAKPGGTYFEFDPLCNEEAVVVFKIRAFETTRQMTNGPVDPILVDLVVLTGSQAKRVVRGESVIAGCILAPLRRAAVGDDIVARMGWVQVPGRTNKYVGANPATDADMDVARRAFEATNGDPYSACERAANPTATLTPAQAPAPAPVAPPAAAPAQPPAADAPAPWGAQPAPVGGPQGPGWGESPAATNAQPVASGSVW